MGRFFIFLFGVLICFSCGEGNSRKRISEHIDSNKTGSKTELDSLIFQNDTIAIYKIDSFNYFKQRAQFYVDKKDTLVYVADVHQARELLKGSVTFGGWNSDLRKVDSSEDGNMIASVKFLNGKVLNNEQMESLSDAGFVRYYPSENILLLEGGHSTDISLDLKNGEMRAGHVGNPSYILDSPNKKYRITGEFDGQECSSYFFQKLNKNGFSYLTEIPIDIGSADFIMCTIGDKFWVNDAELYFRNLFYGDTKDERLGFFRVTIKD